MRKYIVIALVLTATLCACKHDVISPPAQDPGGRCNPAVFTYTGGVKPIIESKCTGCHSGATPPAGLDFSQYEVVKTVATNGRLLGAINHRPGYKAMPLMGNKLSSCEIETFTKWALEGAPNN